MIALHVGEKYKVSYVYDFLGCLEKIVTPGGEITYDYRTGVGDTIRRLPNGVRTVPAPREMQHRGAFASRERQRARPGEGALAGGRHCLRLHFSLPLR